MKTLWIKILAFFLGVAFFENIAFPIAANHGRFDVRNKSMQPYLLLAGLALVGIILLLLVIYKKPLPKSGLYNIAKVIIPLVAIFLIINITGLVPMYLTFTSVSIFIFHVLGILISLWVSISLFLNKAFS